MRDGERSKVTRAVILAAGQGSRLRPLTARHPKCLIEVAGKTVLSRAIGTFEKAGISDVHIVTGYMAESIESLGYQVIRNHTHLTDNVMGSFIVAAETWKQGAVCAYGDILFQPQLISSLLRSQGAVSVAIDSKWRTRFTGHWDDVERTELVWAKDGIVQHVQRGGGDLNPAGEFIGIIRISPAAGPLVLQVLADRLLQDGAQVRTSPLIFLLTCLIEAGWKIHTVDCGSSWHEFDTPGDLDRVPLDFAMAE